MAGVEATYGSTVVRAARPEEEWVDITPFGSPGPVLMEIWRGWRVELWCYWDWDE